MELSMKETMQIAIFDRLKKKEITQAAAAKALDMSIRWVRIKSKRFNRKGAEGLMHLNRGRTSTKRWNQAERDISIDFLKAEEHKDFGPTFAAETLYELHGIKVSRETLRCVMIEEGLWKPKQRKPKHRMRRERKEWFGEMAQFDGSPHDWLEGRGPTCTLLDFVDDATSTTPFMMLVPSESTESAMAALRKYVELKGLPKALYVDFGSTFSVNTNNKERDKITQFERASKELGIAIIHARSPQAKGRVERAHATHQDRLVKELRMAGISTIEEANKYILEVYLPKHNTKFAIKPLRTDNVHRQATHLDLDKIFCIKDTRKLQNDFTISYKGRILQLTSQQSAVVRPKEIITVHEKFDGAIALYIRGIPLNITELKTRPIKPKEEPIVRDIIYRKPAPNHPWRQPGTRANSSSTYGGY